ncbi:MAG: hypothetical protein ACOVMQ_00900 [Cyclobacteriaceae bacterium]|jgi:hypothetical protein
MIWNKITDLSLINELSDEVQIGFGIGVSYFPLIGETKDGGKIYDVIRGEAKGVKWKYNNNEVLLLSQNRINMVYPSVNLQFVIVIYFSRSSEYKAPNNAVIFSANGNLLSILNPPPFQSTFLLQKLRSNRHDNPPLDLKYDGALFFDNVSWLKNNDEIVTAVRIIYDCEWYETVVYYPETGMFGECLDSGRL